MKTLRIGFALAAALAATTAFGTTYNVTSTSGPRGPFSLDPAGRHLSRYATGEGQ